MARLTMGLKPKPPPFLAEGRGLVRFSADLRAMPPRMEAPLLPPPPWRNVRLSRLVPNAVHGPLQRIDGCAGTRRALLCARAGQMWCERARRW